MKPYKSTCSFIFCLLFFIVATAYCCAHYFGPGYGSVWMTNLGCTSSDTNLFSCSQAPLGAQSCAHTKDAGAGCRGKLKSIKDIS